MAILLAEPDAPLYTRRLAEASHPVMSVATFVELGVVVDRARNPRLGYRSEGLIRDTGIELVAVSTDQGMIARSAHRDYGRASGHPAKLNFGDCFAYALAKSLREPLLFKGNDFTHTDIESAL